MTDFHYQENEEIFKALNSSAQGLTDQEANNRLIKNGPNILSKEKPYSRLKVFVSQFKNPLIYILLLAGVASALVGEVVDSQVIAVAVFINVIIGYIQEDKANSALNKLKLMIEHRAQVIRDGQELDILTSELVIGDILVLKPGQLIAADARLFKIANLETNEASLTGESASVMKTIKSVALKTGLADRKSMIYAGTSILSGTGLAIVVATGKDTELGKISELVKGADAELTPLQERLEGVSKFLGLVVLFICLIIIASGLINGFGFLEMFSAATAIAVAAIPEGMAVAVTVILALGMKQAVKKKALARKLVAAETLGSITVICSDKTGTLTEGIMRLDEVVSFNSHFKIASLLDRQDFKALSDFTLALKIGLLNNSAVLLENSTSHPGSALDIAYLKAAVSLGLNREELLHQEPKIAELPFSSDNKFTISLHEFAGSYAIYEKGAGEIILSKCSYLEEDGEVKRMKESDRQKILADYEGLTASGMRVIALAYRNLKKIPFSIDDEQKDWSELDKNLTFVALASFKDPLRKEAANSIHLCRQAGIRPIIITGDHPGTAFSIALELKIVKGLEEMVVGDFLDNISDEELQELVKKINVYARVSPKHKIRIVNALRANGEVVAMTGDGLNDAPALKASDIGICLGSGTEVAKETADLVLLDDNFSVIVGAIKQGRIIFDNIRKSLTYLISDSFSEIVLILGSILFHTPLALLPTQILWINIVNDGFPNFSLAFEGSDDGVMKRSPIKRSEPIFNSHMKVIILGVGLVRDILIFALFYYFSKNLIELNWSVSYLRTLFFAVLIFKSLTSIFSIRSFHLPIYKIKQSQNPYLFLAVIVGFCLMLLAIYLPLLNTFLQTTPLEMSAWLIVIFIALINISLLESVKAYFLRHKK
ncbi:MAG: HAD-IC family P-type ATPase [Patescibacteria group bacterium]